MKSTWFGSRARYEFCKLIAEGGGYNRMMYDSFYDWLKLVQRQSCSVFATAAMDEAIGKAKRDAPDSGQ